MADDKIIIEFGLPIKGFSEGFPVENQPANTSGSMNNVRPTDVLEGRIRLGQRPPLDKWGAGTLIGGAEQPVVAMCIVSSIE